MSLRPGEVFAGYTIERELGAGGMGSVYLARHPRLPRFDALKLLRPELCSDPGFVGRFEREADTVAQLDHPNIVPVYDRGSQDGQLWISMRFIDGTNAEKALADYDNGGMPPDRAVRIVGKVASALDYAHKHQLLHRDVKPANILLTAGPDDDEESERVFLSDFGVAKAIGEAAERISSLTSTGSVVATLDYASPEQIKGQVLDQRTDVYALGCVLYKLLTGTVPFPGESIAARVYGHLNGVVPAPSALIPALPVGFDGVVATAMAKEASDRYPSCRALAVAARAVVGGGAPGSGVAGSGVGGSGVGGSGVAGLGVTASGFTDSGLPAGTLLTSGEPAPATPPTSSIPVPSIPVPSTPLLSTPTHTPAMGGTASGPDAPVDDDGLPTTMNPIVGTGARPGIDDLGVGTGAHPGIDDLGVEEPVDDDRGIEGSAPVEHSPSSDTGRHRSPAGSTDSHDEQHDERHDEQRHDERRRYAGEASASALASVQPSAPVQPPAPLPAGRRSAGSQQPTSPDGRSPSRRTVVIGGSVAAIVVIAAVVAALTLRGDVAGTGTTAIGSTAASTDATTSAVSSSAAASSALTTTVGPVPGLPHSTPLAEEVLIGSRLVDGSSNLFQMNAATGALGPQLTTASPGTQFAIISPDRGSIIYLQPTATGATLRTMAADGKDDRVLFEQLPTDCVGIVRPAWNPVDQTVLALPCLTAANSTVLYRVAIDGSDPEVIDTGFPVLDDVTYSPDGETLAFWAAEAQGTEGTIFTMPADAGGAATQLVDRVPGTSDADPVFSPDGTQIAFRRSFQNADGDGAARIVVVDIDGSNPIELTDGLAVDQDPTFSPDGRQIAFKSNRLNAAGTEENQIWVINSDGTGLKELGVGNPGTGDGAPAWGHR